MTTPPLPKRCALHLDGLADPERLANPILVQDMLRNIAQHAGMRILNMSYYDVDMNVEEKHDPWESGYSHWALITTSHISCHTWPKHESFMFDIVSCKRFDYKTIRGIVVEQLHVQKILEEYERNSILEEYNHGE